MRRDYLTLALTLPPQAVARRAFGVVSRPFANAWARRRDFAGPTYRVETPFGQLRHLGISLPIERLRANRNWIEATADLYCEHRFDLLGSGWVHVAHGMECRGVGSTRFPARPAVVADSSGDWLEGRLNRSNLRASRDIWRLTDPDYSPIDWQIDFKTGFRWSECTWSADLDFGGVPNVDVKVPWELARLQHLATLGWAFALAHDSNRHDRAQLLWREFRNQTLDFIACNPPRFGANWRCAMDVAIRGANLAMAYSIFAAAGAAADKPFADALARSLYDHAQHVIGNLEWYPEGRGNHYLADVAGLAFIAAVLPESAPTNAWLAFALQEIVDEAAHQFNSDGTYFEGSTSYHRFAGEMVVFATALACGVENGFSRIWSTADRGSLNTRPRRPLRYIPVRLDEDHFSRIAGIAKFTANTAKHDGRACQIGDNDSGRFFRLHPAFAALPVTEMEERYANLAGGTIAHRYFDEDSLDHRAFAAAAARLVGQPDLEERLGGPWIDAEVVSALMRDFIRPTLRPTAHSVRYWPGQAAIETGPPSGQPARTIILEAPAGPSLRANLQCFGWPDFGLWLYRSTRLYLAIRCGPAGRNLANHAHNDQLAIELAIDGVDWIADPGSYLYCAPRSQRELWRSVMAHSAPRWHKKEPASLELGSFCLPPQGNGRCLLFRDDAFLGEHVGYGAPVRRMVTIEDRAVTVRDYGIPSDASTRVVRCDSPGSAQAAFDLRVPTSPGYGKLLRNGAQCGSSS
jgi:hypothetical protein